jgi:hypothetical protein
MEETKPVSNWVYNTAKESFVPVLRSFSAVLDKAAQHAEARKIDSAVLLNARLAPDMFPFVRQVQIACDHVKRGMALLAGHEPPKFEDNEQTFDELKARISKTIAYAEGISEASFEGAAARAISFPLIENLVLEMNGEQFLRDWSLPHFYFHIVTGYDILRHNGVELSKRDYMSHIGYAIRQKT